MDEISKIKGSKVCWCRTKIQHQNVTRNSYTLIPQKKYLNVLWMYLTLPQFYIIMVQLAYADAVVTQALSSS